LGQLDAKESISELVKVLDDKDKEIRGFTALVLVELGAKDKVPTKAIEDIKSLLERGSNYPARARAALKELGVPGEEDKSK
jgi:HEAT repeat protein